MAKLTIAQRRERQLERFNNEYIHDEKTARKIFNSYYRYAALTMHVLECETEENYKRFWFKEMQAKEERWFDRLTGYLKPYGLKLFVPWICPEIVVEGENGCIETVVVDYISY